MTHFGFTLFPLLFVNRGTCLVNLHDVTWSNFKMEFYTLTMFFQRLFRKLKVKMKLSK